MLFLLTGVYYVCLYFFFFFETGYPPGWSQTLGPKQSLLLQFCPFIFLHSSAKL
jgi:hypothetical protein